MKKFSMLEILGGAFGSFKAQWKFLVPVVLIVVGINFAFSFGYSYLRNYNQTVAIVVNVIGYVVQLVLSIGMIKVMLKVSKGEETDFGELFRNYRFILYYFVASILSGVAILVGVILLVIPGLYLSVRLQLWPYYMMDKNMGPIAALRASWQATKGAVLKLGLFDLVLILINLMGILAVMVGMLVSVPVTMLAMVGLYRQMSGQGAGD